jgi:hypothetical protein
VQVLVDASGELSHVQQSGSDLLTMLAAVERGRAPRTARGTPVIAGCVNSSFTI